MSFRDDREAAFQRAESLEQELARKQRELDELRANQRAAPGRARWAAAGVAFLAFAGGTALIWKNAQDDASEREALRAREAEARAQEAQARQALAERERAAAAQARLEDEARAQREAAERAAAEAARPAVDLTWSGSLDEAVGVDVPAGSPCTLEGTFVGLNAGDVRSLGVRCAGRALFGPEAAPPAASGRLREGPTLGGGHEYMLSYRAASRDGVQIDVSTLQHRVTVTRGGDAPMRATLFVRDVSAPREGPALLLARMAHMPPQRAPAFAAPVEQAMRVRAARGAAPARAGARCTVLVRPVWEYPENCRMAIRCGGAWVYGAREAGYLTCALRDGRPVAALDDRTTPEGGDPRVNWRDERIVVSDFTEAGEWRLDLAP